MQTLARKALVILMFLISMGVVKGLTAPEMSETDYRAATVDVSWPPIIAEGILYAGFTVLLISRIRRFRRALLTAKPLLALIAFCCLSTFWSTDPSLTVRRALVMVAITLTGILIGQEFDLQSLVRLASWAFLIHIVLVLILLPTFPEFVMDHSHLGSLKGLSGHKNLFGIQMGIAAGFFMFGPPIINYRWIRYLLVGAALVLMLESHSASSIIASVLGLCSLPLWRVVRFQAKLRYPALIAALLAMFAITTFAVQNLENLFAAFSKDSTLTGRTPVWILVLAAIARHPWFGGGFDAFWEGAKGGSLSVIAGAGWLVPNAHNGYLDLLLSTGIIGALIFSFSVLRWIAAALNILIRERSQVCYVPIVFTVTWLIYNLVESSLLSRTEITYLFFVAASTSIAIRKPNTRPASHPLFPAPQFAAGRLAD